MNTRKFPRTLEQAFGPYARGPVHAPREPMARADKIVLVASTLAAAALAIFMIIGWVK